MNHILIPAIDRPGLGVELRKSLQGKLIPNKRIAGLAGLAEKTVEALIAGYENRAPNMRLATIVGLADAIEANPLDLVDALAPGYSVNVSKAAVTYARNMVRPTIVLTPKAPKAAVVEAEPVITLPEPPAADPLASVPTALSLMLKMKQLGSEDRLLVNEFIEEVLAG